MATEEETRAAAYRAEQATRARNLAAGSRALAGSSSARAAVEQAWRPVTDPQPVVIEPKRPCDPPRNAR